PVLAALVFFLRVIGDFPRPAGAGPTPPHVIANFRRFAHLLISPKDNRSLPLLGSAAATGSRSSRTCSRLASGICRQTTDSPPSLGLAKPSLAIRCRRSCCQFESETALAGTGPISAR